MNFRVTLHYSSTYGETQDGLVNVEGDTDDMLLEVNDKPMQVPFEKQHTIMKFHPDGTPVFDFKNMDKRGTLPRATMATLFYRPSAPIALNEPFDREIKGNAEAQTVDAKARTTVLGSESIDGVDCWKLQLVYAEQVEKLPMSTISTLWLSKADHDLIRATSDVDNYQAVKMMPPSNSHIEIKRVPN